MWLVSVIAPGKSQSSYCLMAWFRGEDRLDWHRGTKTCWVDG
jgi:hypothetical protein